jgi:hypothetical protein
MIKRYSFAFLLFAIFSLPVFAQQGRAHQRTAAPAEARFEIVQSSLAVKFTVRLDKYTGLTHQLVEKSNGDMEWQPLKREGRLSDTSRIPGKVNYQIFTSGIMLKSTFLVNVNTGATWQIYSDAKDDAKDEEPFWKPVKTATH